MATALESTIARELRTGSRPRSLSPFLAVAMFLFLAAAGALAVDLPLARACRDGDLPGDVVRVLNLSEVFAHGGGVAMLLIAAWVLDPENRRRLVRVAACAYGAGMLANFGKLAIARSRPQAFGDGGAVLETFQAWLPFLPGRMPHGWSHGVQGFPSAHAATAVGFALGLAMLYPRGRWLFLAFAFMASFQRVAAGAHFLSDTLAGAAVGCLAWAALRAGGFAGRLFDRWEGYFSATKNRSTPTRSEITR